MGLSIGIVGLPNVGKPTLFNALTKKSVPAANYPFCTIDPAVGVVAVPDERLDQLAAFAKSRKKIPAAVEFVDIAGLVKGAAEGEGLGNQFLAHIREVDAIAHVIRVFADSDVTHLAGDIDPLADAETVNLELALADLETVRKRRATLARELKRGNKEAVTEDRQLGELEAALASAQFSQHRVLPNPSLRLLTAKPVIYVLNTSAASENALAGIKNKLNGSVVEVDPVFGIGLDRLISESYKLLGLITFFTTGDDETRAWTIKGGSTAPVAGAAIHSDFRDKFIKAEVINWQVLLESGSYVTARERGRLRTEGKAYLVRDGDVLEFKI